MMELYIDGKEADICDYGCPFSKMFSNAQHLDVIKPTLFWPVCFNRKVRIVPAKSV